MNKSTKSSKSKIANCLENGDTIIVTNKMIQRKDLPAGTRLNYLPANKLLELSICFAVAQNGLRKAAVELFFKRLEPAVENCKAFAKSKGLRENLAFAKRTVETFARKSMRAPFYKVQDSDKIFRAPIDSLLSPDRSNRKKRKASPSVEILEIDEIGFAYSAWLFSAYLNWRLQTFNSLGSLREFFFIGRRIPDVDIEDHQKAVDDEMILVKQFMQEVGLTFVEDYDLYIAFQLDRNAVVNVCNDYSPETFLDKNRNFIFLIFYLFVPF